MPLYKFPKENMQLYFNQPMRKNFMINGGPGPNLGLYPTVSDPMCFLSSVNKRPLGFLNLVGQYRATLPDTHIHTLQRHLHAAVICISAFSSYCACFPSPFSHTHTATRHIHHKAATHPSYQQCCCSLRVSCIITRHTLCFSKSQPGN